MIIKQSRKRKLNIFIIVVSTFLISTYHTLEISSSLDDCFPQCEDLISKYQGVYNTDKQTLSTCMSKNKDCQILKLKSEIKDVTSIDQNIQQCKNQCFNQLQDPNLYLQQATSCYHQCSEAKIKSEGLQTPRTYSFMQDCLQSCQNQHLSSNNELNCQRDIQLVQYDQEITQRKQNLQDLIRTQLQKVNCDMKKAQKNIYEKLCLSKLIAENQDDQEGQSQDYCKFTRQQLLKAIEGGNMEEYILKSDHEQFNLCWTSCDASVKESDQVDQNVLDLIDCNKQCSGTPIFEKQGDGVILKNSMYGIWIVVICLILGF